MPYGGAVPKVFVHGNPEVDAIWNPLVDALAERGVDDVVRLSPPGFGAPTPAGWTATRAEYVGWLVDELTTIRGEHGPIDLVGHDWGAGHVVGTMVERPDLARTWAVDVLGLVHPDYVWHDMAQAWQTPEVGEQVVGAMVEMSVEERRAAFAGLGLPDDVLDAVAAGVDADMGRCILALYRDAPAPVMTQLGAQLATATTPPGLALVARKDDYVPAAQCIDMAQRVGMDVFSLDAGHWWMVEAPAEAADALVRFWSTSD